MIKISYNSIAFEIESKNNDNRSFIGPRWFGGFLHNNFRTMLDDKLKSTLYNYYDHSEKYYTIPKLFKNIKSGYWLSFFLYNPKYNKAVVIEFSDFQSIGDK